MKLRVVRADGRPAGMREIAVRTILRVVDGVGMYIVGLITMLATGQRRQRIGDLAAGTIVVDASTPTAAPPVPAAAIDELDFSSDAVVEDEVVEPEPVEAYPRPTPSITLPTRRERPATLADIVGPDAPEEEPVVEAEPVAEEAPVIEVEPADETTSQDLLPEISSPAIEELARDVDAARSEPEADAEEAPVENEQDAPVEDEQPMTFKSVETVSAIDLVMGAASEDEKSSEDSSESS
jgi:hypothetical protein